jgi:hypothetical protein
MRYVTRTLCSFPPLVVLSFYGTWLAGRLALGYWPRPNLDDPKDIEDGLMWLSNVTAVLVVIGIPVFWFAAVAIALICLFRKPAGWEHRLGELAVALVLFIGLVVFMRWDPQSVVRWYFD